MIRHCFCRHTWAVLPLSVALLLAAAPAQDNVDAARKDLMAANGFFQRGLMKMAADAYQDFLNKYPDHEEADTARYGLAISRYRLSEYPAAIANLRELVQKRQFKQRDEALAVLGHCLLATKEYGSALEAFDTLLKDHEKSKHAELASLNRAQVLYLLNRYDDSLKACRDFIKSYSSSAQKGTAEYFLACSQEALNQHKEAEETLTKLLKEYKDSPHKLDATLLHGLAMENQGRFDAAADEYRKFIDLAGRDRKGEGYYSLGLVLFKAGKYPDSIKELSQVVDKHASSPYAAPARLQLGLAQLAAGNGAEARKTLQKVAKDDKPRSTKAAYWLAQCDIADRQWKAARGALESLAKADPKPDNGDAIRYDHAICTMELGEYEAAAKEFADYVREYSGNKQAVDALYRQAFCLHKMGKYPESLDLCEQVAKKGKSPVSGPAAELAAENLFLMGKHGDASARFEQLAKSAAGDKDRSLRFGFRLGQCAFLSGQFDKAVALLTPIASQGDAAQQEHLREASFFLGDALFQLGKFPESAAAFARYLANQGTRKLEAQFRLGLAQLRAKQMPEAEKTLGALTTGPTDSPWVLRGMFSYGQMAYHELHQPDKAAPVLAKVLASKPPEELIAPTMYLLAWIDFDAKRFPEAAACFADLVKRFGSHELAPDAALQEAICLKEQGKTDEAIQKLNAFVDAYKKSERIGEARHLIGTCLAKLGRHDDAVKVFSDLADSKKTRTEAVLYEMAWSYRKNKVNDKAAKAYEKLLSEFPGGKLAGAARTELAELLYLDKKYDEAAALVEKVVADPKTDAETQAVAQYRLGWCYSELSQHAKAAGIFMDFVQQHPNHSLTPSALHQAGVCHLLADKLDEAQKCFSAVLEKYPNHEVAPIANLKLGEVQTAAGDFEKSAETYKAFLKKYEKSEFLYMARFGIGWDMENLKKYDDARQWYTKVIDTHNGETAARAQFQMGECYLAEKKFDRAAVEYLKVDIVYGYPKWSSLALYQAGRAFEQLGQLDQAKSQYEQCISKYKDSDSAGLCKARLKAMDDRPK